MSLSSLPRVITSGVQFLLNGREKSFVMNRVKAREVARGLFAEALREAFKGETDTETARTAARCLGKSERQVQNWLASESSAGIEDVYTVCALLGVFRTMEILTRDLTRNEILKRIGQE
jgi:hypothetical protein